MPNETDAPLSSADFPPPVAPDAPVVTPWRYLPVLYLMQAIPVTIVQELSSVVYKDLGVPNDDIAKWTSLVALPWALQMLLGPLVDLTATKRAWIVRTQALIAAALFVLPFVLALPYAFELSLVLLAGIAVVSAFCNVATDGFYLLATPDKAVQASFAGVQTTAYRFGRLLVVAGLAVLAGRLAEFAPARAEAVGGTLGFARPAGEGGGVEYERDADLRVVGGVLADAAGRPAIPRIEIPAALDALTVRPDGAILASVGGAPKELGRLTLFRADPRPGGTPESSEYRPTTEGVGLAREVALKRGFPVRITWTVATLAGAALFLLGFLFNRPRLPVPPTDAPAAPSAPGEVGRNVLRTGAILALYGGGYFALSALWKLGANGLSGPFPGWRLPASAAFFGIGTGLTGVQGELAQLAVALPLALGAFGLARRTVRGTPMGEAFGSFFRGSGIVAILLFMLFYRFGEAMVAKMSPLFLKDLPSAGGIGLDNEALGYIKGVVGVAGIIVGGVLGGWTIGKIGLRRALWPLAAVMHAPILLYLWASVARPVPTGSGLVALGIVDFVDQFGYGFGFAGYYVILFRIAGRGRFVTSHYAIGTGLGATFIALAGIASGVLQKQFGYTGFFASALLLTIPGMLSMFFVPVGDDPAPTPPPEGA